MFLDFLTLKPKSFGLDISDLSLKLAQLEKKQGALRLVSFGEEVIKPGLIERGEIRNEKDLAGILKKVIGKAKGKKIRTKYVVASLPEEKAFMQVIELPFMSESEVHKAVYFEAENHIPLPVNEVYLDSQIILKSPEQKKIFTFIAAAPKKIVNSYLNVLKGAGLKPLALEIESQAISRALVKNTESSKPLLLIDLGATRASFIIFVGPSLRLTSFCPISGQQFTQALAQGLKISFKKAEALKIKHGIVGAKEGRQNFKILNPYLNELVEQINRCLSYHQSHNIREPQLLNGRQIHRILLCGGGANLKGLANFLSDKLKMAVVVGNPWMNLSLKPTPEAAGLSRQDSLRYATALGLALRCVEKW